MPEVEFSFRARPTGSSLHLGIQVDDKLLWQGAIQNTQTITVPVKENKHGHLVEIVLTGKLPEHTCIDTDGNILQDQHIELDNFYLDGMRIDAQFYRAAKYTHNFNGPADTVTDTFSGYMGCNGKIHFEFTSPAYGWLLENF